MTSILDNLLNEIETSNIDEEVLALSSKIQQEEDSNMNKDMLEYQKYKPEDQNIFLILPIKSKNKSQIKCLSLERELPEKYIIGLWIKNLNVNKPIKRVNVWEINQSKPKKIIREFAKVYKIYK
jgi:hypothetical protein